ncbi:hypothetical protein FKB34_01215 [Glycocaulis profundi]|nr:hypothetical protein FKB34_01215 [Glycocaulis profundi]
MDANDIIEADEHVVWQDRAPGPGARRVPPDLMELISDYVLPAIMFVCILLGLCLWALLQSTLLARLAISAFAIAVLILLLIVVSGGLKARRDAARSEQHYVLTDRRLIAWDAAIEWRAQILPGSLKALIRRGRNLELYIHSDDEPLTLSGLTDLDAAESAIIQTLGRPS